MVLSHFHPPACIDENPAPNRREEGRGLGSPLTGGQRSSGQFATTLGLHGPDNRGVIRREGRPHTSMNERRAGFDDDRDLIVVAVTEPEEGHH
jgi:hypothetical protein